MTLSATRAPFDHIAPVILERWAAEREFWVTTTEVEQARRYLQDRGIPTTPLEDGRFLVQDTSPVDAAQVVLLGVRHLVANRVRPRA